jgi:hypothetical protein
MLVECINDQNWDPRSLPYIKEFPVKGIVYTVKKRNHCGLSLGMGYVLEELNNPLLPDGSEVGFSCKRFRVVDEIDITEITEVLQNEIAQ